MDSMRFEKNWNFMERMEARRALISSVRQAVSATTSAFTSDDWFAANKKWKDSRSMILDLKLDGFARISNSLDAIEALAILCEVQTSHAFHFVDFARRLTVEDPIVLASVKVAVASAKAGADIIDFFEQLHGVNNE